jgi:hypothetical protein
MPVISRTRRTAGECGVRPGSRHRGWRCALARGSWRGWPRRRSPRSGRPPRRGVARAISRSIASASAGSTAMSTSPAIRTCAVVSRCRADSVTVACATEIIVMRTPDSPFGRQGPERHVYVWTYAHHTRSWRTGGSAVAGLPGEGRMKGVYHSGLSARVPGGIDPSKGAPMTRLPVRRPVMAAVPMDAGTRHG